MNLKDYQEFVVGLISPKSMENNQNKMTVAALGLTGESGEFADYIKKINFHGLEMTDEIKMKIIKELGDIMFYLTFASVMVVGCDLQEIIDINVEKLKDRYKTGKFSVKEFMDKESKKHD